MDIITANQYANEFSKILYEATSAANGNFKKFTKRKSNTLTNKDDIDYILSIDHQKASQKDTIMQLFANFGDGSKYNPYDLITIPPNTYGGLSRSANPYNTADAENCSTKTNRASFTTTVGLWIFNRMFIEPLSDILGYINTSIDKDKYEDINQSLSYALLEDKISIQQLKNFIIQSQIIMSCCSALAPAHTEAIFAMEEDISKHKRELEKKYHKELESGDLVTMKKMEKELIDYAKDILDGDESRDMYDSGARSSYNNNFKNMYIMRSGIKQTDNSVKIVTSSYMEGVNPKDFAVVGDGSVGGPYNKAIGPSKGGHLEHLLMNSTAHLRVIDNTDCGTKNYYSIILTKKNAKDWYYSNMVNSNGSLVELTPSNVDKYIGKKVQFRFSAMCNRKDGTICNACAGNLFKRIGINNIGITTMIMGSSIKNSSIKKFHDTNIKLYELGDLSSVFSLD